MARASTWLCVAVALAAMALCAEATFQVEEAEFGKLLHQAGEASIIARRALQQVPEAVTTPVTWASGAFCGILPQNVYTNYLGVPWWAPTGIAQGICTNTLAGGAIGMSM